MFKEIFGPDESPTKLAVAVHAAAATTAVLKAVRTYLAYKKS